MSEQWPAPVERVSSFLRQMGVEARIEEFEAGTPTAVDAARAVGCKLGQIVKSLVFDCGGRWVVVLVPGVDRVFVDRNLLSHKQVWIGAGSPRHMAVIAPGDLVRLARAQAMDVVEPAT